MHTQKKKKTRRGKTIFLFYEGSLKELKLFMNTKT